MWTWEWAREPGEGGERQGGGSGEARGSICAFQPATLPSSLRTSRPLPPSLQDPGAGTKFLAPEKLRGVGAVLLNAHGRRFVNELATRDVVSEAIAA